jgi:hypothetical protein
MQLLTVRYFLSACFLVGIMLSNLALNGRENLFKGLSETHKFYISKTIIEFNTRTQLFEITCKMFTDDLELALSQNLGAPIHLGTSEEVNDADVVMERYMRQHFSMIIDGASAEWRWVGKEVENDLTYCYLELYRKPDFRSMAVTNDLLIAQFPEQQNIVDLSVLGTTQTLVFLKDHISQLFTR